MTVLACPHCAQPMKALRLRGHYDRDVEIDLCSPCRLVWFDGRESMRLTGLGWIDLLDQLQDATAAARPWRGEALPCPRCQHVRLGTQHNQTRWGRFVTSACAQCHGVLQNHAMLLAERGLLRTPTAADRAAMARVPDAWSCLNCGAAVAGAREDCSYCDTPLLLFDFERLAGALLPGPYDHEPTHSGRLAVWPCHTCGFALDPTTDRHCPQCGQAVLARTVAELKPLLAHLRERWRTRGPRPWPASH